MPGFASRDDLITEVTTNGKMDVANFYKIAASASQGAGVWHTLWKGTGTPGAGSDPATTPGTIYVSDASTPVAGSIWFPDRSADLKYITSFGAVCNQAVTLMLYDRLTGVSGISGVGTGSKTINSGALDRYSTTLAVSNQCWLEVTTASTTTQAVMNLNSYTSADGSTGQSGGSVTWPAAATVIGTMIQMPLGTTKQGIRSVEAGLNVGTATTAAVFNVLVIRPIAYLPLIANQWNEVSLLDDTMGLPRIYDNATLGLAVLTGAAVTPTVWGQINVAYG